jgi:hypothetical protein
MKMQIKSFGDPGIISDERIGFEVVADCDLKFFAVLNTFLYENGGFFNKPKYAFWFAPLQVKAGDKIVLYTKSGIDSIKRENDGTTIYFFYWGLTNSILSKEREGVVLAEFNGWQTKWV